MVSPEVISSEVVSPEIRARVQLAVALASEAGELVVHGNRAGLDARQKSSPTDIATAVDRANEVLIVERVRSAFPHDGLLAEEGSSIGAAGAFTWIVDPLDGTANFVRSLRSSAVSIAIAQDDVIVAGIVFDPYARELFVGVAGEGATVNGEPMIASTSASVRASFVGLSGSNRPGVVEKRAAMLSALVVSSDSVRDVGSTALSLCWTAAGRFDAHVGIDVEWWDFAAGVVIAQAAGCVATGVGGAGEPDPSGFLVCPPALRNELAAILASAL